MPHYRLYAIDSDGHIERRARIVTAENDKAALTKARTLKISMDLDCWEGSRHVGLVRRRKDRLANSA